MLRIKKHYRFNLRCDASLGVSQRAGLRRGPGTSFSVSWLPMNVRYKLKHMTDNYLVYHTTSFQNMGQTNRHTVLLEARYSSLTKCCVVFIETFPNTNFIMLTNWVLLQPNLTKTYYNLTQVGFLSKSIKTSTRFNALM